MLKTIYGRPAIYLSLGMILPLGAAGAAHGQTTATYIGPNNGAWNDPLNWDIGMVPINGVNGTFNVIIPDNTAVDFDIAGEHEITGLALRGNSRITLTEGRMLETLGVTGIDGLIDADGPDSGFLSLSPFTVFVNNGRGRAWAQRGGVIAVNTSSYSGDFGNSTLDVFVATDAGSVLDLSSLTSLALPGSTLGTSHRYTVRASNQGVIDLSNVTNIQGAGGNNWARFQIDSGGTLDLVNLHTISGRTYFRVESDVYTLPSLDSVTGASVFSVADGGLFRLPSLATATGATLAIDDGGVIEAPVLSSFTHGLLELTPDRTLIAPPFTNVDHSRFAVRAGGVFDLVAASSYVGDFGNSTLDVFVATDAGSVLDLSSLTSLALPGSTLGISHGYTVRASNQGVIDLSNVTSIQGAGGNNWAQFQIDSGGTLDFASLQTITGRTTLSLGVFERLALPALTSMAGTVLDFEDGALLEAPHLTSFTDSFVDLAPLHFLVAPPFTDITRSRFVVRQGAVFDGVAASSYVGDFGNSTLDVFVATDAGSVLDLSSLTSLALPGSTHGTSHRYTVRASNQGVIDLSNVTSIQGAGGNNWALYEMLAGGSIRFGNATFAPGRFQVVIDGSASRAEFLGSATFPMPTQVTMSAASTMAVAGSLTFDHTDESLFRLDNGVVHMNGSGIQSLEIAGADLGLPDGDIPLNFQIGQLSVGRAGQATRVVLVDEWDNGNRGPNDEPELLYLQGFPADNGLRVLGGSILFLNNLEAYAVIGNNWTRIRDLFPIGVTRIAFDDGFIDLGAPCPADINGDGELDANDFFQFLDLFAAGDLAADLNGDGVLDANDFFAFLDFFAAGCGG